MLAPSLFPFATTFIPAVHQPLSCGWWQGIVGRVIGRGGETIRALQQASQAHIVVEQNFPEGVPRKVVITGRPDAVERAVKMVTELIQGSRQCAGHHHQGAGPALWLQCSLAEWLAVSVFITLY